MLFSLEFDHLICCANWSDPSGLPEIYHFLLSVKLLYVMSSEQFVYVTCCKLHGTTIGSCPVILGMQHTFCFKSKCLLFFVCFEI